MLHEICFTNEMIIKHIDTIYNPYIMEMTLIAMLEIKLNEDDPRRGFSILTAVIDQVQSFECFTHANEKQLVNLLATYVRVLTIKNFRILTNSWDQSTDDILNFGRRIWNICSPFYDVFLSQRSTLFAVIINKLEGIEVAFDL